MSETSKQTGIMENLRKLPFSEWEKATVTNRAGSQDVKGHWRGHYIAIELKVDDKDGPNVLQTYRIIQTNKKCLGNGISFWASDWQTIKDKLSEFAKTKGHHLFSRNK